MEIGVRSQESGVRIKKKDLLSPQIPNLLTLIDNQKVIEV
jgi:hypothetical protein